jgi:hypothetical protein
VARRKRRTCRPAPDPDVLLAQLRSADEQERVKALHRVCPCPSGFLIEELDAGLDLAVEQGWRYSDADWMRSHRRRQATRYWLPL